MAPWSLTVAAWVLRNRCHKLSAGAAYSQQWTAYKNAARKGTALGLLPVAPSLGVAPAAVAPNIIGRATALVARIKVAPGYTDSIGQALQIIGTDQTVDVTTLKPVITVALNAGQITVGWTKQGMDAVEIFVDRGDGKGFVFLAVDTVPDYTDTQPLPVGQSTSGNTKPTGFSRVRQRLLSSVSRWRGKTFSKELEDSHERPKNKKYTKQITNENENYYRWHCYDCIFWMGVGCM